jgi:hypothetical protein
VTLSFFGQTVQDEIAPAGNVTSALSYPRQSDLTGSVGQPTCAQTQHTISDAERERHIRDCAWLMERAWDQWEKNGCFAAKGEADRWRLLMEESIKDRPAEYVRQLEQASGLA